MNEKNEEKAFVGRSEIIVIDLLEMWYNFAEEYSIIKGLEIENRNNRREYRDGIAKAWVFAFRFWLKVKNGFKKTWDILEEIDAQANSDYIALMNNIEKGVQEKDVLVKYTPDSNDLHLASDFMSDFIHKSGIGDVEFKADDGSSNSKNTAKSL